MSGTGINDVFSSLTNRWEQAEEIVSFKRKVDSNNQKIGNKHIKVICEVFIGDQYNFNKSLKDKLFGSSEFVKNVDEKPNKNKYEVTLVYDESS